MKALHLTYDEARAHYPELVAQALKSMTNKFRRAKKERPSPDEMLWELQWASGTPEARPPLAKVSVSLHCSHERRRTIIRFADAASDDNSGAHLPYHVQAYYKGSVDPAKMRHAATFQIRNPNGSVDTAIATGGYSSNGAIAIHYLIVGEPWVDGLQDEELIEIRGNRAAFEGGLKDLARERYEAAGEGGDFSFGSKTMHRLTFKEIQPHVQGKTFNWSLF